VNESEITWPTFSEPMAPPSLRTMDEINQWIEEDFAILMNRERYDEEKLRLSVSEPFHLR
jgi:hypothetical protein